MYCSTETGIAIFSPYVDYAETLEKLGTIGKVSDNYKLRVVDNDTRKDVPPETYGELLITGDCLMLGYFKDLNATKASLQDGYFKTGDLAKYDCTGWLYVEGRIVDLITIQGCKMSPRELETVILMHPFVKDTVVISNGQLLVACVIAKTTTKLDDNKLITFISERLPVQKWPNKIVFMDDFPTTTLGKVRRDILKEEIFTIKIERSNSEAIVG